MEGNIYFRNNICKRWDKLGISKLRTKLKDRYLWLFFVLTVGVVGTCVYFMGQDGKVDVFVPEYARDSKIEASLYVYDEYVLRGDIDNEIVSKSDVELSGDVSELEEAFRGHLYKKNNYLPDVIGGDFGTELDIFLKGVSDQLASNEDSESVYDEWKYRSNSVEDMLGIELGEIVVIEEELTVDKSLFKTLKSFDDVFVNKMESMYPSLLSVSVRDGSVEGRVIVTLMVAFVK